MEFLPLLSLPVLPQFLLQLLQLTLPSLLNFSADLQRDVPLLLPHLGVKAEGPRSKLKQDEAVSLHLISADVIRLSKDWFKNSLFMT